MWAKLTIACATDAPVLMLSLELALLGLFVLLRAVVSTLWLLLTTDNIVADRIVLLV